MYAWIYRHIPGPTWAKVVTVVLAGAIIVLVLMEWVFPWLTQVLPFQDQTVGE